MASSSAPARLEVRLPGRVYGLLKRAAELQGRTLAAFVVAAAHKAATRAIREAQIVHLSLDDQERVARGVLKPKAASPALRRAFRRRRALLASSTVRAPPRIP